MVASDKAFPHTYIGLGNMLMTPDPCMHGEGLVSFLVNKMLSRVATCSCTHLHTSTQYTPIQAHMQYTPTQAHSTHTHTHAHSTRTHTHTYTHTHTSQAVSSVMQYPHLHSCRFNTHTNTLLALTTTIIIMDGEFLI